MDINKIKAYPEDVAKYLLDLDCSKAMGPDNIHPKLLKYLGKDPEFVDALTMFFNKCIDEQRIPDEWKSATVVPIHKKGSVHVANNYRPVSLTCIMCKIYEKILRRHLLEHVESLISTKQHGFMKNRSCLSNILETLDIANEYLAEGNCADILYFDFKNAFDSVPHNRLITKLESYGLPSELLNIIRDFLTDRKMKVRVGDAYSSVKQVTSGVPQGSVLGPLLFLLFVNDIPDSIKGFIVMFADDVKIVADPRYCSVVQEDLNKLNEWEQLWGLDFNVEKCKVLHLGKGNPLNQYVFGGEELSIVNEESDLGVIFCDTLGFQNQIQKSISKAKSAIGWLSRAIISRDVYVMKSLYKSIIRPHLEYCVQAWAPVARYGNWALILEMEDVQRSFTRLIEGIGLWTYKERLDKLKLTTLLERRMRGDLIETFKVVSGIADYGTNLFKQSRSGCKLIARPSFTRFTREKSDFFSQRVLQYWNRLPRHVQDSPSVNIFKNRLDQFRGKGLVSQIKHQYWELSDEIFQRLDVPSSNRLKYTNYMRENPIVAKLRRVNIR